MLSSSRKLTVLESCDGCGACCLVVASPPFRRVFDEEGEEAWERLRQERPDLLDELLVSERTRRELGEPAYGRPCIWYDPASRRCKNYELRPNACRLFAVDSADCHDARRRAGIEPPRKPIRPA